MPENVPIEKKFTHEFTNLISACRRFWLYLLSSLVCFGLWWPCHSSMDKHYRERIYHILLGPTGTHKTPTFSRDLVSASEFIRVTTNMWACLRSYYSDQQICFQVSSTKQTLPIKAMVRSLPIWSMWVCCFSHQWLINIIIIYAPTYISSVFNIDIRNVSIFPSNHSSCLHDSQITLSSQIIHLEKFTFNYQEII